MHGHFLKYFSLFIFLTLFVFADNTREQPSEKEETKDTIVVHGKVLHGRIIKIGSDKLSFKLLYSDGVSRFAYKDIESIETKYTYHISYNRMDIIGRVVGIEDNKYLKVVEQDNNLRTIKIADIDNFVMSVIDDDSIENVIRNKFPYTKGDVNIGFAIDSGSTIKNSVDARLNLHHKKAHHEVNLYVDYEYETRESPTTPKYVYTDELVAILTYRNHYQNKGFWYTSLAADYDRPRHVDERYSPSVGLGHRFDFGKSRWLTPAVGVAYVYTRYTDDPVYPNNNFAAAAFTITGNYKLNDLWLIDTLDIDGFIMYYPSITNPGSNWISRSNLNFTMPIFDFLSIKLAMTYINNTNPDPTIGNNKTTSRLLFGLDF
jgi:putative salt-induced outer membrane protein YdiY